MFLAVKRQLPSNFLNLVSIRGSFVGVVSKKRAWLDQVKWAWFDCFSHAIQVSCMGSEKYQEILHLPNFSFHLFFSSLLSSLSLSFSLLYSLHLWWIIFCENQESQQRTPVTLERRQNRNSILYRRALSPGQFPTFQCCIVNGCRGWSCSCLKSCANNNKKN